MIRRNDLLTKILTKCKVLGRDEVKQEVGHLAAFTVSILVLLRQLNGQSQ